MASDEATLSSLDNLLTEFFGPSSSNERKRQIEELLNNFALQDGSWKQCMYFLSHSSNQYVLMYAFSIFENLVNQRWHGLQGGDKQQIRKFLYNYMLTKHSTVPIFIRNKSIRVVVIIGRHDWPMFYPSFFSNTMQLLQRPETSLVGVLALQIISEEFISPREDLSMQRRQELKDLLLQHIPNALHILTELLTSISHKFKHIVSTFTPPPSPNQLSPRTTPNQSPVHRLSIPTSNFSPNSSPGQQKIEAVVMSPESEELCTAIFNCLTQYISWLPLSRFITPALVSKIFNYAEYGCNLAVQTGTDCVSGTQVGINAMNCINEILSKKFIPAEYESFLMQMFQQTFKLLQIMTNNKDGVLLASVDQTYVDKFTEFLNLFVGNHLRRFEPSEHFPTVELLYLFLKYTMQQILPESFVTCLEIWIMFLDYLIDKVSSCITINFKMAAMERYVPCLQELSNEVLKKIQFKNDPEWLASIGMEKYDDDSGTDWEEFIRPCLDVLEKLSQLLPEEVFAKCSQTFQENLDIYFGLSSIIANGVLNLPSEKECENLHITLLDLGTLYRIVGRLSALFTDDVSFRSRFEQSKGVVDRLVKGAIFGGYYKTYQMKTPKDYLQVDLVEVHAQAIASVKAYSHWLIKCQNIAQNERSGVENVQSIIISILDIVYTLFDKDVPERISLASAHLLVSILTTVRPNFFLAIDQGQKLFQTVDGKIQECNETVQTLVYRALSNSLILPWPMLADQQQEWEMRSTNHKKLIASLCKHFNSIDVNALLSNPTEKEQYKEITKKTCHILSDIIDASSSEGTKSRKIVYNSIQEYIELFSNILGAYVTETDVADKIMLFLLECVRSLKLQMGTQGVETLVNGLLGLLKRDQIVYIMQTGSTSGINALNRFLNMLELIVQEHNPSFKKLLPNVIEFSLESMLPILNDNNIPDLKMNLLELFHQLLLHNWRYFFKANVLSKMNGGEDQIQHEEQFLVILKTFGQPLMETEIALFKKSIEVLESVNSKHKLYQKPIFQSTMLSSFLQVLLNSLIEKSHNLLQEEIMQGVYSMVSVNFDAYFTQFIPTFLMNLGGLSDHQKTQLHQNYKRHQDVPSFVTSLQQFVGDLRYLQIINSSLPKGTISL